MNSAEDDGRAGNTDVRLPSYRQYPASWLGASEMVSRRRVPRVRALREDGSYGR